MDVIPEILERINALENKVFGGSAETATSATAALPPASDSTVPKVGSVAPGSAVVTPASAPAGIANTGVTQSGSVAR